MALKFGYWGRIWGAELLCGRVERKSTAIFDWLVGTRESVWSSVFLWRHQFQETYVVFLVQNSELLGLSRICGFDHFGAMFDLAVCLI